MKSEIWRGEERGCENDSWGGTESYNSKNQEKVIKLNMEEEAVVEDREEDNGWYRDKRIREEE